MSDQEQRLQSCPVCDERVEVANGRYADHFVHPVFIGARPDSWQPPHDSGWVVCSGGNRPIREARLPDTQRERELVDDATPGGAARLPNCGCGDPATVILCRTCEAGDLERGRQARCQPQCSQCGRKPPSRDDDGLWRCDNVMCSVDVMRPLPQEGLAECCGSDDDCDHVDTKGRPLPEDDLPAGDTYRIDVPGVGVVDVGRSMFQMFVEHGRQNRAAERARIAADVAAFRDKFEIAIRNAPSGFEFHGDRHRWVGGRDALTTVLMRLEGELPISEDA